MKRGGIRTYKQRASTCTYHIRKCSTVASHSHHDFSNIGRGANLHGFWQQESNRVLLSPPFVKLMNFQRGYLQWLGNELSLTSPSQLLNVSQSTITQKGGSGLLNYYDGSILSAVKDLFPNEEVKEWQAVYVSANFWSNMYNQRRYLEWLADCMKIETQQQWYSLELKTFKQHRGSGLTAQYNNSIRKLLKYALPEYSWNEWMFEHVPNGFWKNRDNIRKYIDWLAVELGFVTQDDFYKLKPDHIRSNGGSGLMHSQDLNVFQILQDAYPEFTWLPWKLNPLPQKHWHEVSNHRKYMDWVAEELGVIEQEDWYRVSIDDVKNLCGSSLIRYYYNDSLITALEKIYGEFKWYKWHFHRAPAFFWSERTNQLEWLNWACDQLSIETQEELYSVNLEDFECMKGGHKVLQCFDSSPMKLLKELYCEFTWYPWLFSTCPRKFWWKKSNQRMYIDWYAETFQIENPQQWYETSYATVKERKGAGLLRRYNYSIVSALLALYPETVWNMWQQRSVPTGFWEKIENRIKFMKWVGKQLNLKTSDDWQTLTYEKLRLLGGSSIVRYGRLEQHIALIVPNYIAPTNEPSNFTKAQRTLIRVIKECFIK